ncbi:MAG: chorismate-binding protein, partial [Pseudomonadales bacterium]|nr:chorismate-binding protein [Pseudomonadales bacterium]
HLVSTISGELQQGLTAFSVLRNSFPGGSITGAPKVRAMEIIDQLETTRRSVYCGSLFYVGLDGNMDSNIMIRTILCENGKIHCWGGGGIVADSQWEHEYQESLDKIDSLLKALDGIQAEI